MEIPLGLVWVLFLREGSYDGTFQGTNVLWDVYSEYDKAVEALKKETTIGPEAKCWALESLVVDEKDGHKDMHYFSLDGVLLEDPPVGPKFVPPIEPPPGRCQFVYICGMQSYDDLDISRCTKEGYHRDHETKNNVNFDHNCQEHLSHFPHIWTYNHSKDPKEVEQAKAELVKLGFEFDREPSDEDIHYPGAAT